MSDLRKRSRSTERGLPLARREFANVLAAACAMAPLGGRVDAEPQITVSSEDVRIVSQIAGEHVPKARLEVLAKALDRKLEYFQPVRELEMSDATEPPLIFVVGSGETFG